MFSLNLKWYNIAMLWFSQDKKFKNAKFVEKFLQNQHENDLIKSAYFVNILLMLIILKTNRLLNAIFFYKMSKIV
jgi:hypothetical protein